MSEGPFQTSRDKYLNPRITGVACVGSKSECRLLLDEGAAHVKWGQTPERLEQINALYLMPTPAQVKKPKLPEFLPELSGARRLVLPAPLLTTLTPKTAPPKLVTLLVDLDGRFTAEGKQLPRWPDELVLPKLRGLMFTGTYASSGAWPKLGVTPRHVPGLEFFHSDVDSKGEVIDAVARFESLRHLELGGIGNFDNLFEVAPAQLEILQVGGSKLKFLLAGITRLRKLQALRLNTIKTEIDCRLLCQLPDLVELDVLNSKRISNVEALLECPSLRRVSFLDCGGPFNKPLCQRFEDHGFDSLAIKFA